MPRGASLLSNNVRLLYELFCIRAWIAFASRLPLSAYPMLHYWHSTGKFDHGKSFKELESGRGSLCGCEGAHLARGTEHRPGDLAAQAGGGAGHEFPAD